MESHYWSVADCRWVPSPGADPATLADARARELWSGGAAASRVVAAPTLPAQRTTSRTASTTPARGPVSA